MTDLKKFPVKLAVDQDNGKFYVYGTHIVNFDEITAKLDETNQLLTTANASLVDANGNLVDINGNLVEIDGELVTINTVEGSVTDAAVTGDADGTLSAKLRGLTTQMVSLLTKQDSQISVQGETDDAAVTGDADGTLSAKLRGLTTQMVSLLTKQDSQISVQGETDDTAVTGDNDGTISAKLRGLTTQMVSLLTKQDSQLSVQGETTDAAVTGDTNGSISAKLRGLTTQMVSLLSNQTDGSHQTKITDGTNLSNVLKSDGTSAGNNALLVAPTFLQIPFTTSTSGAQILLPATNVSHYSWVEIVFTSVGSGLALTGQFSPTSGGTYVSSNSFGSSAAAMPAAIGAVVNRVYFSGIRGNYFQLALSALTSGTVSGIVTLRSQAPPYETLATTSNQGGAWSVGLLASATGGYSYAHIAPGQATTVIKASAGTLHSITFGGAATATNVTTVYDNASGAGAVIGIPSVTAITSPITVIYDVAFALGLTIITSAANGADMTVAFK